MIEDCNKTDFAATVSTSVALAGTQASNGVAPRLCVTSVTTAFWVKLQKLFSFFLPSQQQVKEIALPTVQGQGR